MTQIPTTTDTSLLLVVHLKTEEIEVHIEVVFWVFVLLLVRARSVWKVFGSFLVVFFGGIEWNDFFDVQLGVAQGAWDYFLIFSLIPLVNTLPAK